MFVRLAERRYARHASRELLDLRRELRFRHVVHYLIFDEYTQGAKARQGTRINIGDMVARIIPEDL